MIFNDIFKEQYFNLFGKRKTLSDVVLLCPLYCQGAISFLIVGLGLIWLGYSSGEEWSLVWVILCGLSLSISVLLYAFYHNEVKRADKTMIQTFEVKDFTPEVEEFLKEVDVYDTLPQKINLRLVRYILTQFNKRSEYKQGLIVIDTNTKSSIESRIHSTKKA